MKTLKFFYRSSCSLCDAVAIELEQLRESHTFEISYCDVDSDEEWHRKYNLLVPVITDSDEKEICHYHFDEKAVLESLQTI